MMYPRKPIVTVLEGDAPVFGLEPLYDEIELNIVDAAGLPGALPRSNVLLLWDFFSPAAAHALAAPSALDSLDWIHIPAAGVDGILTPEIIQSSITVTNATDIFNLPIAEYVLACVLAHFKDLHVTRAMQHNRQWVTRETRDISGARALIVGAGGIGRAVANYLRAVGMKVTVVGRNSREDTEFGFIYSAKDLVSLVSNQDVVIAALPLTASTRTVVSADVIRALDANTLFVNVGRGLTVDEESLTHALVNGSLGGAALDTFQAEPLPTTSALWDLPHVFISPHMSSRTGEWRRRLMNQFLENFAAWRSGKPLMGVINKTEGYRT